MFLILIQIVWREQLDNSARAAGQGDGEPVRGARVREENKTHVNAHSGRYPDPPAALDL